MKRNFVLNWLAVAAMMFFAVSCSDDNNDTPTPQPSKGKYADYSCLIVNQGNFREKNADISYYREGDNTISNTAFYEANGRRLAAFAESATVHDSLALIICNTPDKIEVINVNTAKAIYAPIESAEMISPRYAVVNQKYAYVTSWGGESEPNGWWDDAHLYPRYDYPKSNVLKIDLTTKAIVKKMPCRPNVEGILLIGDKLFVAVAGGVDVFSTATDEKLTEIEHKTLAGNTKHFGVDKNDKIWYSIENYANGFGVINPTTLQVEYEVPITTEGYFAMSKAKDKVVFFTNEKDSNWSVTASAIYTINVDSKAVSAQPIFTGTYLSGVGVNPNTDKIYTAEVYGYTSNATLKLLNAHGTVTNEAQAGVGAGRFIFY